MIWRRTEFAARQRAAELAELATNRGTTCLVHRVNDVLVDVRHVTVLPAPRR